MRLAQNYCVVIKYRPNLQKAMTIPVNYELKITNYEGIIEKVEITDLTGKIIINSQFSLEKPKEILNSIDVSTLPQGMYLIKIYTDKGVVVEKFVKQ